MLDRELSDIHAFLIPCGERPLVFDSRMGRTANHIVGKFRVLNNMRTTDQNPAPPFDGKTFSIQVNNFVEGMDVVAYAHPLHVGGTHYVGHLNLWSVQFKDGDWVIGFGSEEHLWQDHGLAFAVKPRSDKSDGLPENWAEAVAMIDHTLPLDKCIGFKVVDDRRWRVEVATQSINRMAGGGSYNRDNPHRWWNVGDVRDWLVDNNIPYKYYDNRVYLSDDAACLFNAIGPDPLGIL